jgi:hypothetical protein
MGSGSGPALLGLIEGQFHHARSGMRYRVFSEGGKAWLSFDRDANHVVHGKRELLYFIGSGHRGRTYLFAEDGFLFESPINWYAQKKMWDMTPAYQNAVEMPLTLPTEAGCLNCHTSGMRSPAAGTENRYPDPPFAHGGITCQRCHGAGGGHGKSGDGIVNPARLPPERRDDICMECHTEGNVAIERPGRHVRDFVPGERLADYIRYFVVVDPEPSGLRAVSQFEALAESGCKRAAGDAMWCGSCHDPHVTPSREEKNAYYRSKCLACHRDQAHANHYAQHAICTECHMPPVTSADVAHTQATDHRIPRFKLTAGPRLESAFPLKHLAPFPANMPTDVRDLALAGYALFKDGQTQLREEAQKELTRAVSTEPSDPTSATALAYMEQENGNTDRAKQLYEQALRNDPSSLDAATNLGVIEAQQGHTGRAVRLWEDVFARAPGRSADGLNLAVVFCAAGKFAEARLRLQRVLEFNPDFMKARKFLDHLNSQPPRCEP